MKKKILTIGDNPALQEVINNLGWKFNSDYNKSNNKHYGKIIIADDVDDVDDVDNIKI